MIDVRFFVRYNGYSIINLLKTTMNTVISATQARANLYRLIDDTAQSHIPVFITGKQNNAVLISEDDWQSIQETLHLSSIPGMSISIKEGLQTPIENCSKNLDW